jgi:hypothetical protein
MPVSKKRKKDGKPVHRTEPAVQGAEHAHGPESSAAAPPPIKAGKPSNPFIAQRPPTRGSQRGR